MNSILTFHLVGVGRVFQKDCVNKQDSAALVQKGSPSSASYLEGNRGRFFFCRYQLGGNSIVGTKDNNSNWVMIEYLVIMFHSLVNFQATLYFLTNWNEKKLTQLWIYQKLSLDLGDRQDLALFEKIWCHNIYYTVKHHRHFDEMWANLWQLWTIAMSYQIWKSIEHPDFLRNYQTLCRFLPILIQKL